VAIIAPNVPAIYEAHFGVPMSGAVINCVNIRLNAPTVSFLLDHSKAEVVIVDQEFYSLAEDSLKILSEKKKSNYKPPLVILIRDPTCDPKLLQYTLKNGAVEYEKFLEKGDPGFEWRPPRDEWQSISLGYTSGTTSSPKGVVLHHRGAYLMALSGALVWGMNEGAVYLWTLPMFHCNGWCYAWTLAALCGTSVCLRQVQYLTLCLIFIMYCQMEISRVAKKNKLSTKLTYEFGDILLFYFNSFYSSHEKSSHPPASDKTFPLLTVKFLIALTQH
jgi:acetate/butyrate---CoA ligase